MPSTTGFRDRALPVLRGSREPGESPEPWAASLAEELAREIEGEVRVGRHDRLLYATDASIYQVEPLGVVIPRSEADVETTVRFAARHELPLLPRGGGTSLAGQCVNRALIIDMAPFLNRIISIDPAGRTAIVQPGVVLDDLNTALASHGLMFGPDVATSSHANLGGMIGNNSAGAHSVLYGRTVEHLRGIEALLADGRRLRFDRESGRSDPQVQALIRAVASVVEPLAEEIDRRFPRIVRHVDGYNLDLMLAQMRRSSAGTLEEVNLAHLLCGSEGTLAVTVQAELNLVERPALKGLTVIGFPGVDQALGAVGAILATGPAAVELIDEMVLEQAARNAEYRRYLELLPRTGSALPGAVLYVEHFAANEAERAARWKELEQQFGAATIRQFGDPKAMQQAWKLRKAGEPLLHGMPGARKPITFVEDLAVDPLVLPQFVAEFRSMLETHGTRAAYYAHASVGCLHIRPLIDVSDLDDRRRMEEIAQAATDLVLKYGGALSGEHGDGRLRSHLLERFYGPQIVAGFARIKAIFDPHFRMNPGIIVDPQTMAEHLRVEPEGRPVSVPPVNTFFRYEPEQGFGHAVTLCNGAGVCRRMHGGTMCPSYRATRDERHSTRGRGNALRLAITGQFARGNGGEPLWDDGETLETLDLCLSCKACKSECPSNVDLSKLKAEYLAQSFRRRGSVPLQARAFGQIRRLNWLGSTLSPLSNAVAASGGMRWLAARLLDIDRRRSVPRFERSLDGWFRARPSGAPKDAPAVVLFPDCFTLYNEPRIGRAAVRVLEALGYRVILPRTGCCGRSMISCGDLEQAVGTARSTARQLFDVLDEHDPVAVVGCEPSCVSAITDDWLDLKLDLDPARLETLAARTAVIEQFLESGAEQHPRPITAPRGGASAGATVLLHGHCHQKALWGLDGVTALLRRFLGERLEVLDSGCCGMAGGFGYTADHYDLSMQIGELSLFPPIRAQPDAIVLAPGTSCRHQIHDGTARRALHPIELIAETLTAEGRGGARRGD